MDPTHPRGILESLRDHIGNTMPPRDPDENSQGFQFPKTILIWFEAHPAAAGRMQATTVLQMITARIKMPISNRKMTPVTATVRNTASADRNCMARLVCRGDYLTNRSEMVA